MFTLAILALYGVSATETFAELPKDGEKGSHTFTFGIGCGMDWAWTYKKEDDTTMAVFSCVRECEGKKHKKHDECDLSCDKECPSKSGAKPHMKHLYGETIELGEGNNPPKSPHAKTVNDAYSKFGFPSTWNATTHVNNPRFVPSDWRTLGISYTSEHWNTTPCSTKTKTVAAASYIVTLEYKLWDKTNDMQGKPIITYSEPGTLRYRMILPKQEEPTSGDPIVNCKCEVKQEESTPKDHGYIPGFGPELHYATFTEEGNTRPLTGTDANALFTNVAVQDMNNATLSFNSWMTEFYIPSGWEFECLSGGGQDVQLLDDFYYTAESALPNPFARAADEKRVRVLCLNIDKPEPRANMKYRLVPPRNALIQRAASISRDSNFRGPWDQMRLWIATDQASYEKIAKVLIPTPGPSTYIAEMHRLAIVGAIDPYDTRYLALMDFAHAFAPVPELRAVEWMVNTRFSADRTGAATALRRAARQIADAFEEDAGSATQVVTVFASVLSRHGDAGLDALVWLTGTAVPQPHRADVAIECGGYIGLALENATDPSVVNKALAYLEQTRPIGATGGLLSMNEKLPDDLRKRGEALSAQIWPGKPKN